MHAIVSKAFECDVHADSNLIKLTPGELLDLIAMLSVFTTCSLSADGQRLT